MLAASDVFGSLGAREERGKLALTVAAGIAFGYAASLFMMYLAGGWPVEATGRPAIQDFLAFWVAGKLTLKGAVLVAYDPARQHAAEVVIVGRKFDGALGWAYPPIFLFVAATVASLPYAVAFVAWVAATCAAQAAVVAAIAKRWGAAVFACAAPWALTALMTGQNGFLTAALTGLVLLNLERRALLAGMLLGLLSYKPQLGILFPLALAAGGYWRAFAAAAASAILCNGLAAAFFGFSTLGAFAHALSLTSESHLVHDGMGWWFKLQSAYGLVRDIGGSSAAAMIVQLCASVAVASGVWVFWRSRIDYRLKAAFLAAALPLATPYVFAYDLPVLTVSAAFLFRHRSFDKIELALLASTIPSVFAQLVVPIPSPLFASLAVAAMALRRCYGDLPRTRMSASWVTEATSLPSAE